MKHSNSVENETEMTMCIVGQMRHINYLLGTIYQVLYENLFKHFTRTYQAFKLNFQALQHFITCEKQC